MFWNKLKTKDIRSTTDPKSTLQEILRGMHSEDDFHDRQIDALNERLNSLQSKLDKGTNELQSQFDKKLSKLENRLSEKLILENITKFLLDKEGLRLYKLKEKSDICFFQIYSTTWASANGKSAWEDEVMCEDIDIDELKTLGDYTTITVGKQKYFIAKRRVEKKKK